MPDLSPSSGKRFSQCHAFGRQTDYLPFGLSAGLRNEHRESFIGEIKKQCLILDPEIAVGLGCLVAFAYGQDFDGGRLE